MWPGVVGALGINHYNDAAARGLAYNSLRDHLSLFSPPYLPLRHIKPLDPAH